MLSKKKVYITSMDENVSLMIIHRQNPQQLAIALADSVS